MRITAKIKYIYLIFTLIIFYLFPLVACQERIQESMPPEVATLNKPATSPTGKFVLVVTSQKTDQNTVEGFRVLDKEGGIVFAPVEQFPVRSVNYFLWDQDDRIWVYSGDLGTFFWQNEGQLTDWKKYIYAENDVPAPEFLKQVRPRWHQR